MSFDDSDFFGEKELRRNRRYIFIGVISFASIVAIVLISVVAVGTFFNKSKSKIENASGELNARNMSFDGVKIDLENLSTSLSGIDSSEAWTFSTNADPACTSKDIFGDASIYCNAEIETVIFVESQKELGQKIDVIRSTISSSELFKSTKVVSTYEYPQLVLKTELEDLDSTVLSALNAKDEMVYERWGVPMCSLTFSQIKNSDSIESQNNEKLEIVGSLICSEEVKLNEKGHALP